MENINLSKTLLGVYRYIPRVVYAYDKIVETRATNSYCVTSNNTFNDVMVVSDFILNMSTKKVNLINLKLMIEKALKGMDYKLRGILIMKFIDGKKSVEIADKFKFCLRTFFRKLNVALASFYKQLVKNGYFEDKIFKIFEGERWILDLYNSYENIKNPSLEFCDELELRKQIKTSIISDLRTLTAC